MTMAPLRDLGANMAEIRSRLALNENMRVGMDQKIMTESPAGAKIPDQVLDLVDQIKAQATTNQTNSAEAVKEQPQQPAGPMFVTLRPIQNPFDILKDFLTKKRQSPKYVLEQSLRLSETLGNSTMASKSPRNSSAEKFDEDKCLQMILSPEFIDNLSVIKQGSGSTIAASTQSEQGQQELRKKVTPFSNLIQKSDLTDPVQIKDQIKALRREDIIYTEKADKLANHQTSATHTQFCKLPEFDSSKDYEFEYMRLFHDNEKKLQSYDALLQEREKLLKLYQAMKNGDYSHMNMDRNETMLAHQSTQDIFKTLIPQLREARQVNRFGDDVDFESSSGGKRRKLNTGEIYYASGDSDDNKTDTNQSYMVAQRKAKSINKEGTFQNDQPGLNYSKISMSSNNYPVSHRLEDAELEGVSMVSGSVSQSQLMGDNDIDGSKLNQINNMLSYDLRMHRRENQRKKHVRRCAKELKKEFPCLYNCGKEYATDAARNMHMREKHNEVTKTERDRKARDIIRKCGLKNNSEIVSKLSLLTKQQQKQLQSELLIQTSGITNKENDKQSLNH